MQLKLHLHVLCLFFYSFLVTGDVNGHIKFYDEKLKLISLYSQYSLDPIRSISFSKEIPSTDGPEYKEDCTMNAKPLILRQETLHIIECCF